MSTAIVDRRAAALRRAAIAKLVAYKLDADTYEVPSSSMPGQMHLVRRVSADRWSCTCAAHAQAWCMHRETACYANEAGISASRKRPLCANCHDLPVAIKGDWCACCATLKHACEERDAVAAAERVVHQAFEGAEKALRAPAATSITRVKTRSVLDFD